MPLADSNTRDMTIELHVYLFTIAKLDARLEDSKHASI